MKKYKCHKIVEAEPATKGEVEAIKEKREISKQDTKTEKGYLVKYEDGYISWSPKKAFEDGYTEISK
jgi:hypothetical protein